MYNSGTSFADIEMPDNDIFGASTNNGDKVSSGVIIPYKDRTENADNFPVLSILYNLYHNATVSGYIPDIRVVRNDIDVGKKRWERKEIFNTIRSFADLPPGWDGEDGVAPSKSDIDNALDFISKISLDFMKPKAMIAGDGDVGFTWRKNDDYIEVGFPNGEISYCATVNGERFYGDASYNGQAPPELLLSIERISAK